MGRAHDRLGGRLAGWVALAGIVAGGLWVRLAHNDYGLPYVYNVDEGAHYTSRAIGLFSGDANPGYFQNPSGYTYLLHAVFRVAFGDEAVARYKADPTAIYALARGVAALLCIVGVVAVFAVGRRLWGVAAGVAAAAVLSFAFLPVAYSRVAVTDVGALAPVALAVHGAVCVHAAGERRHYLLAGAAAGLAIGFKYTAGLALLPLLVAGAGRARAGEPAVAARRTALALGAAAAAFLVTTPYFLLDLGTALRQLDEQAELAEVPKTGQGGSGVGYYLDSLTWGLGWLALAAACAGAALELRRDRLRGALLVALPLALLVYLSVQSRWFGRWLLPAYPVLALFAGLALARLAAVAGSVATALAERRGPPRAREAAAGGAPAPARALAAITAPAALALLLAATLAQPLAADLRTAELLGRPDTREQARAFLVARYGPGLRAVIEPAVPRRWLRARPDERARWAAARRGRPPRAAFVDPFAGGERGPGRDYAAALHPGLVDAYRRAGTCVVVTMSVIRGRAENARASRALAYYRRLERESRLVYSVDPTRPGADPPRFHFDLSYNHYPTALARPGPAVRIYRLRRCRQRYGAPRRVRRRPPPRLAGARPMAYAGPEGRVALAGWRFRRDPADAGLAAGWPARGIGGGERVRVPHPANPGPLTGPAGVRNYEGSVAWYERELRVPASGRYALRFESAHHRATVWLDGRPLGEHVGAYLPFEHRPRLRAGRAHRLTVRVDWRDPTAMKRAGWHRGWFNYGGLHREVTLRRLGRSEVVAPAIRTRLLPGGDAEVTLSLRVRNRGPARRVRPRATLAGGGRAIAGRFPAGRIARGGERTFRARVRVPDPALWSPERPALYDLRLTVPGESAHRARVGLREIRRRRERVMLNGRPLFLAGASLHEDVRGRGDALRASDQDALVARLRSLGANATRAQHPLSPALLERLDAAGILVWQEIGPWDSPGNWLERTPAMRERSFERVRESVAQLQLHPSILAWNLGNEVGGAGHPGQDAYVDRAARWLHAHDPGRLVALDAWGIMLPRRETLMWRNVDAIGATNYIGWYEWPFAGRGEVTRRIRARMDRLRRAFPDRALFATEFGAEGNRLNAGGRHGGYGFQADLLRTTFRAYRALPYVSGMLAWNLQDFGVNPAFAGGSIVRKVPGIRVVGGLNQKGLFSYDGRAKPAARVAAREIAAARRAR